MEDTASDHSVSQDGKEELLEDGSDDSGSQSNEEERELLEDSEDEEAAEAKRLKEVAEIQAWARANGF